MARSKLRKSSKKVSRARKNPAAWKFAVGIPVAIGAGYLLYKYVFMNEAEAAELVEGGGALPGATPASLPGQTEAGVAVPAGGSVASGPAGADGATGPGGTTLPSTAKAPVVRLLPASGTACYAGKIGGRSVKLKLTYGSSPNIPAGRYAKGVITENGKQIGRIEVIVASGSFRLMSFVGDSSIQSNFKTRVAPVLISDASISHMGWTLAKSKC